MIEEKNNYFSQSNLSPKQKQLDLLRQELDVNLQEQLLLKQRIATLHEFLKNFPSTDPQYIIYIDQIAVDKIELDELKTKEEALESKIKNINNQQL